MRENNVLTGMGIRSLVGAAVAASVVVVLSPTVPMAFAADGTFTYVAADGKVKTSANPPSGDCLKVAGSGPVKNLTNADVSLYKTADCTPANRLTTVDSGDDDADVPTFQSLRWGNAD
jgi:hypothetical protein